MPHAVSESEAFFHTVLPKRTLYFLRVEAAKDGVTIRRLVERVLKEYLESKGVVYDTPPNPLSKE